MDNATQPQSTHHFNRSWWIGVLLLSLPPLFWAGNFIVGRSVRFEIPPLQLSFYRWVLASLLFLPFSIKVLRREWPLYLKHKYLIILASVTGISAFNTLIYWGLQSTKANNALILNAFIPLLISLLGVFVAGLKLRAKQWLGLVVSFVGVLIIIARGDPAFISSMSINQGDAIVFVAMICWAIYTLSLKSMPKEINRLGLMSIQMLVGLVFLAPFFANELVHGAPAHWTMHAILSLVYVGIVPSVIAYLLYTQCIERLGPTKAGMSINLIPVFGVVLSTLFLGETVHAYQAIGMVCIFIGIALN